MTTEEMIEILIEDKIHEWCDARLQDGLEWVLEFGWKGYENFSDKELQDEFEELDEENFDEEKAEKIRMEKFRIKQRTKK